MAKKRSREPDVVDGLEYWQCTRCMDWKTREQMNRCSAAWNGLAVYCKECQRACYRVWYAKKGRQLQAKRRENYQKGKI